MSVLLAVATNSFVALCADRQHTSMQTGEIEKINTPKIETFADGIGVAHCGSAYMSTACMISANMIFEKHPEFELNVEHVADVIASAYSSHANDRPDIERKCTSTFVIAGRLRNGNYGLIVVDNHCFSSDNYKTIDGVIDSQIKIFPPIDVDAKTCTKIVDKNIANTRYPLNLKRTEAALRGAVRDISLLSRVVSLESQFWSFAG